MDTNKRDTLDTLPADHVDDDPDSTPSQTEKDGLPDELDEYRIIKLIGQGSTGRVFMAEDRTLQRIVALKLITPRAGMEREQLHRRFLAEARAAARFQHMGIVAVHRAGIADGLLYLVEEYIDGSSLAGMPKPVPWRRALELGRGLASALQAAHRRGVLHRDIKPANILVARDGTPKLVDFGLAKLVESMEAGESAHEDAQQTDHDSASPGSGVMGTPYYMAPEIWRGESATMRSDVYGLGVVLYELCAGRAPFHDVPASSLPAVVASRDATPLTSVCPGVEPRLAAIVDRCLARDPADRYAHGSALWDALESLHDAGRALAWPGGSPYRGLLPFEAEHSGVFFGRDADIRRIVERLRHIPMVVVAGESGVGKSSLIRAGVLPRIAMQGLDDGRLWETRTLVPGIHPLARLGDVLAEDLHDADYSLPEMLAVDPAAVSRLLRRQQHRTRGVVIFVDQLEELVTVSEESEAAAASNALACLAERTPGIRVVAAVRGDKVASVAEIPGMVTHMERALEFLRPLDQEAIRETVVGPARIKGVRFESEELVETLIRSTEGAPGGLPLLQFAMAQLWERRNIARGIIPDQALDDIGGVEGALSQHADEVMNSLLPGTRRIARRLLLQLVGPDGTRRPRTAVELDGPAQQRQAALDALIAGRLVVARESRGTAAYELAHEVLASKWNQLRRWLDEEGGARAVKERLSDAAAEWERKRRPGDMLWSASQLSDVHDMNPEDWPEPDRAFLLASRRAMERRRRLRYTAAILIFIVAGGLYPGIQYWQERQTAQEVDRYVSYANPLYAQAKIEHEKLIDIHDIAFDRLQQNRFKEGEALWQRATGLLPEVETAYDRARFPVELAYQRDPGRDDVRSLLADILHARAMLADAHGDLVERDRLVAQIAVYGGSDQEWKRPIRVSLHTSRPGLPVGISRYRRAPDHAYVLERLDASASTTPAVWNLEPGSYLMTISVESDDHHIEVRYPFYLRPVAVSNEPALDLRLTMPAPGDIPHGFVYVAGGPFLYGYGTNSAVEPVREWYQTMPFHERRTGPYLIARGETTYSEWIEYLQDAAVRPIKPGRIADPSKGLEMELRAVDGGFEWSFQATRDAPRYQANTRNPIIRYKKRDSNAEQDWRRFPVTGISATDADAYTAWLDSTGRVPGARLCREDEWERAARGADGRLYAHGDRLEPNEANFDLAYGQITEAFGFDEVGSRPGVESPFGLLDTIGNARELTVSIAKENAYVQRGGFYFTSGVTGAVVNREDVAADQALPHLGFRVCADLPAHDSE